MDEPFLTTILRGLHGPALFTLVLPPIVGVLALIVWAVQQIRIRRRSPIPPVPPSPLDRETKERVRLNGLVEIHRASRTTWEEEWKRR